MDAFVIKALVDELNNWFCPGLIKKSGQTNAHDIWLYIKGKREAWLLVSANDFSPMVYAGSDSPGQNLLKTSFALALSKNLLGGEITQIIVKPLERILLFTIVPRKAGHSLKPLILIAELIHHNSSVLLMEADTKKILACSKVLFSADRRIAPGEKYLPRPNLSKLNPLEMKKSECREIFLNWSGSEDLPHYMTCHLFGLSPVIAEEIVFRAGLANCVSPLTIIQIDRLWNSLKDILEEYAAPVCSPVVIINPEKDTPPLLASFPLKSKTGQGEQRVFTAMNDAAGFFYKLFDEFWAFKNLKKGLENSIRRVQQKFRKRISGLEGDLGTLKAAEREKDYADIIMAHLNLIKKGMSEITLPDLYRGGEVSIPLDPAKGPVQNAKAYFKMYGKAKRGKALVNERKEAAQIIMNRLCELDSLLRMAKDMEGLREVEASLLPILDQNKGKGKTKSDIKGVIQGEKAGKALPGVRIFKIDDLWTVMVGKTDKANDHLTKDLARPDDIWLHVYNAPGAHAVLRNPKRLEEIPIEILKKAAGIAAFFSSKRNEDKALVSYTPKKYIRKSKGMKPGQVMVYRQKTLLVKPSLP